MTNMKPNKTINPICTSCDGSASCATQDAIPPLSESIPDGLLHLYLEMRTLELIAEVLRHFEPEQDNKECPDDEKIAVQLYGAETPEVLTCGEISLDYGDFMYEFESLDDFICEGLILYYDPEEVEHLGGRMYLTGAAVVCSRDEYDDLCSLSGEDIYHILGWAERQRVMLSRNGEKIPALRIN